MKGLKALIFIFCFEHVRFCVKSLQKKPGKFNAGTVFAFFSCQQVIVLTSTRLRGEAAVLKSMPRELVEAIIEEHLWQQRLEEEIEEAYLKWAEGTGFLTSALKAS